MKIIQYKAITRLAFRLGIGLLLVWLAVSPLCLRAQSPNPASSSVVNQTESSNAAELLVGTPAFRIEKIPVAGGAEIITLFAKQGNFGERPQSGPAEIPLVSILRDTLGDDHPENDRLRYVWMLTYTRASFWQKTAAFVPFLYTRTTNKGAVGTAPPPPIADMSAADHRIWSRVFWVVFKKLILGEMGVGPKASALQYRQNTMDYRRSSVASALAVLSLYESVEGEKVLSDAESKDIQAKLWLTDKTFGEFMQNENLHRVYDKELANTRDLRGHNWELLRQYSEAQGLYFEPLETSDGTARHAIVWAAAEDIPANKGRTFDSRFLNIKNPWKDETLANWKGYSQVRWFDEEDRVVAPDTPNAKPKTMIPLAIYGLDHPKIPIVLVDFRDKGNAKRREMSRRVIRDLTGNVLSISQFTSIPFFFGRFIYDFATGRRGADLNQASRLRSYAQLKMLLALDATLDPDFRSEIASRIENLALNPLENDLDVEVNVARSQYKNLMDYSKRPEGLPAALDRDRREEMVRLAHTKPQRAIYSIGHFLTFGLYTHREAATPELLAKMDVRRQLNFHERVVSETAFRSTRPEVDSDVAALKTSLKFISEHGSAANEKTARSLAKIFAITDDEDMRGLCLAGLYRIDDSVAKKQLLAIYKNTTVEERWRTLCAQYLKRALGEGQRITTRDAVAIAGITGN